MTTTVSKRSLNRATLARQLLLERTRIGVAEALKHLVGLQAQTANTWYTGLWSRLDGFDPAEVSRLLVERDVVRVALMRSTIHLVTAEDALWLRPLLQPAVERPLTGERRRGLRAMHDEIAEAGRMLLRDRPLTNIELGQALARRWPAAEPADLAMAVRVWVPLVQVPPRGVWGASGAARHVPLESWLPERPTASPPPSAEDLVVRYLAAFGPATVDDAQVWSGLTRLREAFETLRPELLVFRDESGRELFDLPDAPRPQDDTPAPPRFLYDFDNLLLSHADRTRFLSDERREWMLSVTKRFSYGTLLVDGFVAGVWRISREDGAAVLAIRLAERLAEHDSAAIAEEGERLLAFWSADAERREVRFESE